MSLRLWRGALTNGDPVKYQSQRNVKMSLSRRRRFSFWSSYPFSTRSFIFLSRSEGKDGKMGDKKVIALTETYCLHCGKRCSENHYPFGYCLLFGVNQDSKGPRK